MSDSPVGPAELDGGDLVGVGHEAAGAPQVDPAAALLALVAAPVPQAQRAPLVPARQQLQARVREDGRARQLLVGEEEVGPGWERAGNSIGHFQFEVWIEDHERYFQNYGSQS